MSSAPSWTLEDLAALETALAKGVRIVKYADKEVTYRTVAEMIQIRDMIRRSLGCDNARGARRVATTNKALC